ncbi:MAG: PAS domain S-box protein [Syntrophales bacterium]|jgi:PAS domain S-box-containing protein|nr:PAS domain S-box protein [Syntrophales bacterium]
MKEKKLPVDAEQDARKVLEELRATLYSIGDGVITTDAVGHITQMNPVAEGLTGWNEAEALGKPLNEVFRIINEKTRTNVESPVERVLCEGQLTGLANHTLLIARDGTERPIADSGAPIRDERGEIAGVVLVFRDRTAERAAQRALQESEERYRTVADYTYDWEYWIALDASILYMSPSCERITGYRPEEFVADPDLLERIVHPDDRRLFERHKSIAYRHDEKYEIDFRILRRDGEVSWIGHVCQPVTRADGTSLGLRVGNRDITDRKRAEAALHRLNRELQAISKCNQALLRAVDEQTLLNEICRIICDDAGYHLAWVGYAEHDEAKTVRPVAWAGFDSGYIASAKLTWAEDAERGRGPAGKAIRSGEIIYVQDFTTSPHMASWRESALQRGYRSGIALPLKDENAIVFGVLLIYSTEANAITPDEIRLMEELAGDLAFGIIALHTRTERQRAEERLHNSESRLNEAQRIAHIGSWELDLLTNRLEWSHEIYRIFEIDPKQFGATYEAFLNFVHPEDRDMVNRAYTDSVNNRIPYDIIHRLKFSDGRIKFVHERCETFYNEESKPIRSLGTVQDITERKRIDNIMQARLRLLEVANLQPMDELLTAMLDEMEALTGSSIGFYHFLEADQRTLLLQHWSTNTLKNMCTAAGKGSHYPIAQAGVWVDCVYERRPIIHNDYASLPHRKGMPEGHAPVIRELVVPIFRGDLIKAVVGVGNKPTDYDESDVEIVSQLGDFSWDIVERKQAEEALKESEERYRLLFRRSPVGVFHYDTQLHITDCNDRFVAILQSSRERLVGLDMETLQDQSVLSALRQAAEGEEGFYEGFYRATTSSAEICISMRTAPLVDQQGQVKGGIGIVENITERKLTEDALRRSEDEKTILNQIANVFLTISGEAIYGEVLAIVLQVMKSKFGIFGFIGENGDLVMPSLTREIWKECQVPGKSIVFPPDSWGNSLWGRAIGEKKTFYSDGPFRTPEGHVPIDHFLAVPIVYGQETIGLISVANKEGGYAEEDKDLLERIARKVSPILYARSQRDAQERRRIAAEEDLRESEEKYRLLITNADEAIFIAQDEVVKFPNPKALEMSGYSMEELAVIPFIDLVHPGDKDTIFKTYLRVLENEQPFEVYPFRIVNKKSQEMWVQLTTAPIIWEKKQGILCFLRDVTQEKKLEAQFMQAQKMEAVGRLAGGVAHDFNNMLGVIMGYTELALEKVDPSQPLFVNLQEIRKSAERSADLTRQLLAFARKQTVAPKVLDLNETVEGMLKILRRLIGEDINLAWLPGTGVWPVKVDPSQIDQILANLCVNARDAIAEVGKVTIETQPVAFDEAYCADHPGFSTGEYVLLAVSDNGCGMDKETLDKLFEPFFTTKEKGKGTGLGLATVYGIVKQNNGFINVYSEPGKGSTFKIYIPRFEGQAAAEQMQPRSEPARGSGETVLLVEDELSVLKLSQNVLERLGYKVLPASTPVKAIQLAEEYAGKIDLLITDVVMPEINGRDLAERLLSTNPKLKQLFMSGYTGNVIAHHGLLDEGVHFIQKPFSIQNLAAKVREVLDQKST